MSQAVTFISYLGSTLALCAARPNWDENMTVDLSIPTSVTRAILGSESRRAYATSNRYELNHLFDSIDAEDSTDLRKWLERLKDELVAAPMWTDQVTLAAGCAIGSTALQKTAMMPVRYGAEWLIVSDDGSAFEIVVVTAVASTTITLSTPGTVNAWPSGTHLYPLLFGRLKDRPEFTSDTSAHMGGRMAFKESSAYTHTLFPRAVPASLVGSHIAAFATYKLWTVRPNWSRLLDTTESDMLIAQVGFGRDERRYRQQNWNRRVMEMEFQCERGSDDMAAIEYLFNERAGSTRPFFIPTFRSDLELASDVSSGASTFTIKDSRYLNAAYDDPPGNAFLAFVDAAGIYPQRVTNVNPATAVVTVESPTSEAHPATGTNVSFLVLVRLAESKLSWTYDSDGLATCKVRFIEQPSEYTVTAPNNKTTAFLYEFTETLPNGTINYWRYTSYEQSISFGGQTFTPAPVSHGSPHYELNLRNDKCDLKTWGGSDFVGNPVAKFLPHTLNGSLLCTVTRVNRDSPGDGSARIIFTGRVAVPKMKGVEWSATIRDGIANLLEQKYPRKLMQKGDNYIQFTAPTGINSSAWRVTGTIASISGQVITVTGSNKPLDWFSGGWIETGAGANNELRSVYKSTVSGTTQTLTLDRPLVSAIVGQSISMYPGYDGSFEQSVSKFANRDGFGAYPFMPRENPNFPDEEIKTPTGGKK